MGCEPEDKQVKAQYIVSIGERMQVLVPEIQGLSRSELRYSRIPFFLPP
jgi:hypothetical protein